MKKMESFNILARGLAMGFAIAAPVGPIGLLCIRRTLQRGFRAGLASGLGAASADAFYGSIAAAGLTLVADFLAAQQFWLGLAGGAFLMYLGTAALFSKPAEAAAAGERASIAGDYFSTLALTLSNPVTIFTFAAIFSGMLAAGIPSFRLGAVLLVAGVFCGSALWWLTLSTLVTFLRERISPPVILLINRLSGLLIMGFGAAFILRALTP